MSRRVAVTGVGVVSSIGIGFQDFSAALMQGTDAAGPVTVIDVDRFRTSVACEVKDFASEPWLQHASAGDIGRAAAFAVAASRMAVQDAFDSDREMLARPGAVVIGTSDGGSHEIDRLVAAHADGEWDAVTSAAVQKVALDAIPRSVASEIGLEDVEVFAAGNACAASNQAIGLAADAILAGDVEFAIAGGADALCRRGFAAFSRLNVMASERCSPFDVSREGLLLGEGAAMLILEDLDSARERGAHIYAEVLGYASSCDGHHPVQPLRGSVADCLRMALERSGVEPHSVDMVSAHGTATPTNDVTESLALADVFEGSAPPVTAVKSMIGHTMGAAGAMGALACIAAIEAQMIPPTINLDVRDPNCPVDVVAGAARPAQVSIAQNNAFGFFGNNVSVIFGSP